MNNTDEAGGGGYLKMPHGREEFVPKRTRRFSIAVALLLCYIVVLALLYKYSSVTIQDAKEATCDAVAEARPDPTNLLLQILHGANLIEHAERKQASKTIKARSPKEKLTVYFPEAHSTQPDLSTEQLNSLQEFSTRVLHAIPDLHHRVKAVGWGGSQAAAWWLPHHHIHGNMGSNNPTNVDEIEGGRLLWHYYKIMSQYMNDPFHLADSIHFPFKLCKHGCSAEQSIQHSLEWREKYQPWRVSPAMIKENDNGWVYHRGFSPPAGGKNNEHYDRHALVWIRPGQHRVRDSLSYFRCIINAVDRAIGGALHESHGRVGKFNVIVDGSNYEWSKLPDFAHMKQTVTILQDHYTNRLGMVFLINISRPAEFIISLIKPIITKEVRNKIHIVSHDPERRAAELASFVEPEFLPDWLGGRDTHQMDSNEYYSQKWFHWSDKEGTEFLTTMAYHATS